MCIGPLLSSCSVSPAMEGIGGGAQTTLIAYTDVTHSMKPSADPPHTAPQSLSHTHTFADSAWSAGPRHSEPMSGMRGGVSAAWEQGGGGAAVGGGGV